MACFPAMALFLIKSQVTDRQSLYYHFLGLGLQVAIPAIVQSLDVWIKTRPHSLLQVAAPRPLPMVES